jgi:poly(3-hydroxybutyrate) depolymerase
MGIGEFGEVRNYEQLDGVGGRLPLYQMYEAGRALMEPTRAYADMMRMYYRNPLNPVSRTETGRTLAAMAEVYERATRRYGKPNFDINAVNIDGEDVAIIERVVWKQPFCNLVHFAKDWMGTPKKQPRVLIVAPMSGHYSTLLRGTVRAMLPDHDVYITDWTDARLVPVSQGVFTLDDFIDYLIGIMQALGGDMHVMAVCQPAVPVLAAVSLMEAANDPMVPSSMILMGGPIDTRENPTEVNNLAQERGIEWFERHVIMHVPFPQPGFSRAVYPGFLQLMGFMSMNMEKHMSAHWNFYNHLVADDGDSAEKHREFYDEYLAVMDMTAEFYLQTVDTVFVRQALPKGEMTHRGVRVEPQSITRVGLMTVEGERDDISGVGQTKAAHTLCRNLSSDRKMHWMQPKVGHYGVFNGSRFEKEIVPKITTFIRQNDKDAQAASRKIVPLNAKNKGA